MQYCGACGRQATGSALETHHRKPQNAGGEDDISNLIDICADCHTSTHLLARMMKRKGEPATALIREYLEINYPENRQAHEILIELARTVVMEEEGAGPKEAINVMYKPQRAVHQKLKDMARESKVSMLVLLDNLIEAEWRRRRYGR